MITLTIACILLTEKCKYIPTFTQNTIPSIVFLRDINDNNGPTQIIDSFFINAHILNF